MADKKISQLAASTTPLAGTEVLPIVQGGATVKVAVSDLTAGRGVNASSFTGPLTGNVTGNVSGTAATVTGATQAAITTAANLTTVGALNSGSITSGFGAIDVGTDAISGGSGAFSQSNGGGIVQIGSNAGANYYQYLTCGGINGGVDYGWQIGRSPNTGGVGGYGGFYIYDMHANATRMVIDSGGRFILGATDSYLSTFKSVIQGATSDTANFALGLYKAGTPQILSGDVLGNIYFYGVDNNISAGNNNIGARISCIATTNWTTDGTTTNADLVFYAHGTTSGSPPEGMRVTSTGDIRINTGNLVIGTAGKGIDFSADSHAAGMTSELLDDYEEGTWTPVLTDGTNNATMDSTTGGTYTKIGNQVYLAARVATTSLGSVAGNIYISGLPFTCVGFTGNYAAYANHAAGGGSGLAILPGSNVALQPDPGTAKLLLKIWNSATGSANMTTIEWSADGEVNFKSVYTAD